MTSRVHKLWRLSAVLLLLGCHTVSGLDELEVVGSGSGGGGAGGGSGGGPPGCVDGEVFNPPLFQDTYISSSEPTSSFGDSPTLLVGAGNRTLLMFDISDPQPLRYAEVCLVTTDQGNRDSELPVSIHPMPSEWDEATATWDWPEFNTAETWNGGDPGPPIDDQPVPLGGQPTDVCWDVTDHIATLDGENTPPPSFLLDSGSDGNVVTFQAYAPNSVAPTLTVTYCAPQL